MMTGRYPHTSGVYFLSPDLKEAPVLKNLKTMPEVFADHGYKTMAAGKSIIPVIIVFFRVTSQPVDSDHDPKEDFTTARTSVMGLGNFPG